MTSFLLQIRLQGGKLGLQDGAGWLCLQLAFEVIIVSGKGAAAFGNTCCEIKQLHYASCCSKS